jgi:hypothetical protein
VASSTMSIYTRVFSIPRPKNHSRDSEALVSIARIIFV